MTQNDEKLKFNATQKSASDEGDPDGHDFEVIPRPFAWFSLCSAGLGGALRYVVLYVGFDDPTSDATALAVASITLLLSLAVTMLFVPLVASKELLARVRPLILVFWLIVACLAWRGLVFMPPIFPLNYTTDSLLVGIVYLNVFVLSFVIVATPLHVLRDVLRGWWLRFRARRGRPNEPR